MIWRLGFIVGICSVLWCGAVYPQSNVIGSGVYGDVKVTGGGGGYSGPGDQVSGATAWYGVVGYNAAYATGSNAAGTIRCSSGPSSGSTFVINILTTGLMDIATAATDCGTDGVVTAGTSGSSTTLTISAKTSGQVTIGDQITGVGITNPTWVSSVGTCVSGAIVPSCTVIMSQANTVTGGTTVTAQGGRYVTQWNDQTGNSGVASATTANQLPLLQNCPSTLGSIPCMGWVSTGSTTAGYTATGFVGSGAPFTLVGVANRTVVGSFPNLIGASSGNNNLQWRNSANTMGFFTSNGQLNTATMSDGASHVVQGIATTSAGSTLVIDTTATSPGAAGGVAISGTLCFPFNCGNSDMTGYVFVGGFWPSGFNATQYGNVCHVLFLALGTSVSC
jgi:hypothetical protein